MKLSVIIPTHNRGTNLPNVLNNLQTLRKENDFEIIVVDNNSTDDTKNIVAKYSHYVKYIFEANTSFTKARHSGAIAAKGGILLFLDDDVVVCPGSLKAIDVIFCHHPECGIIAGKILPKFFKKPQKWTLECQKIFNGWSLYNPHQLHELQSSFQEVSWAAGPMMVVRKDLFFQAGGFPPDTIGVETNKDPKSFRKLYVGPGDYGLCYKIKQFGFKIYYSANVVCYHVIPTYRFTVNFWRSRIIGEGYHHAISDRGFYKLNRIKLLKKRFDYAKNFLLYERKFLRKLKSKIEGLSIEELWLRYYKAYLDMDMVLQKYPNLWKYLWKIGLEGVSEESYANFINTIPPEYLYLTDNKFVFDPTLISSYESYQRHIKYRGFFQYSLLSKVAKTLLK